jgi:hypothetical protein
VDSIQRWQREEIRKNAANVTQAVEIAGRHVGVGLFDYQATYIAEVARTFAEGWLHVRHAMHREEWAIEDFRAHVRRKMRFDLLDTVTSQGFIPVDLPAESLKYMDRFFIAATDDLERPEGIPAEAVEQGAEWETVILVLSVPVRRPPVDRAAAVKAGILTGSGTS